MSSATSATLVDTVISRSDSRPTAVRAASVFFFAALTAAAAQISIPLPFTAVPLTLQPTVVLLGGLALGPRLGLISQLVYLAAGIAGLPVFAASAVLAPGVLRLLGPTGGYLMSYPLAAFVVGALAQRGFDRRYLTCVAAMLAGLAVVYACGAAWLAVGALGAVSVQAVLIAGVYPFVVPDVLKLLVAAGITPAVWRLVGRPGPRL